MFNPETFMQSTITEANDTRVVPCPVGEYQAQITDLKAKSGTIGKGERTGETWAAIEVHCEIEDEGVKQVTGRNKVTSKAFVMLDLTPDGMLDMGKGKNIRLGKLRDAAGLNQPGQAFSFPQLIGQRLIVNVAHRPDNNDASIIYDEITGFRKL